MIFFDTETTGFTEPAASPLHMQPKIIEFAAIKVDDDFNEVDRLEFLCNPNEKLRPIITKVTSITDDMLKDEKPFAAYYNALYDFFFGETKMVAHNVEFDKSLLMYDLRRIGMEHKFPWPKYHICTVQQSMTIKGYRLKLSDLYQYAFNEQFKDAHRAMPDVEALVKVGKWMYTKGLLV